MVNFRDPAVIAQDSGACNIDAILQEAAEFSFSGACQAVAHPVRSLHVRVTVRIV